MLLATSRNDIVLAVMLVAIVFMMILPLPTWLVDVLIGVNMTGSAMLLLNLRPSPDRNHEIVFEAFTAGDNQIGRAHV